MDNQGNNWNACDHRSRVEKPGKWRGKSAKYESVNTPPNYSLTDDRYQRPESEEEEYNAKFPFALDDAEWQHEKYEYPSVNLVGTPGTTSKKHKTLTVGEIMEKKYAELIEGYRDFKKGDVKPSHKVKDSIREIAKKLQEIETILGHTTRLKNESGVAATEYGPAASKALNKISERLIKISERVRSLGE